MFSWHISFRICCCYRAQLRREGITGGLRIEVFLRLIFTREVPFPCEEHLPSPLAAEGTAELQFQILVGTPGKTGFSLSLGPAADPGLDGRDRFDEGRQTMVQG